MMFKEMTKNPALMTDGYKICHKEQYPDGISMVYETWTARKSRIPGITHVVAFGMQGEIATLYWKWQNDFFNKPMEDAVGEIIESINGTFSNTNPEMVEKYSYEHFEKLHKLGYLPIRIKAVKEGTFLPIGGEHIIDGKKVVYNGVPIYTIENTLPEFFWLPGYLETTKSCLGWQPMTAATISDKYKRILTYYAELSGCNQPGKVFYQGGDFSMRGMGSPEAAYATSAGHLTSFGSSATIMSRNYLMAYYNAKPDVLAYVPSTEHSVMESYGKNEKEAFIHFCTEVYPSGNFTCVIDTNNTWGFMDDVLTDPEVKAVVLNRNGKVNIRPDSGDPVDNICGDKNASVDTLNDRLKPYVESIRKGLVQRVYEEYGGTKNEKGYIELNPHIGLVYGDSITPEIAVSMCERNMENGFATTCVGLGIGSYTYQYVTRDTFGFALKGTAIIQNGEFKAIFKDPATDTGMFKKSQKGLVAVVFRDGDYQLIDGLTPETIKDIKDNELQDIFVDGNFVKTYTFDEIRGRIEAESKRVYKGRF